jgi:hypothetical protein
MMPVKDVPTSAARSTFSASSSPFTSTMLRSIDSRIGSRVHSGLGPVSPCDGRSMRITR